MIPKSLVAVSFLLFGSTHAAILRHHYPLDTGGGDALGSAALTANGNSVTFNSAGGAAGSFVALGGSDDYLLASLDAGSTMSILGDYSKFRPFSVSFWVRQSAAQASSGTQSVFGMTTNSTSSSSYNTGFEVITRESSKGLGLRLRCRSQDASGDQGEVNAGFNVADGIWHHVVAVYETNSRSVYVDGVYLGRSDVPITITTNPIRYFAIGAFIRAGNILDDLNGDVDDLQVYEGAVNATEAAQLYQNPGKTLEDDLPDPPPDPSSDPLDPNIEKADIVDTMIGVSGTGSCVPGPCLPNSSVYPSPDTLATAASGYQAGSPVIGFSQLHASGAGSSTLSYGNFLVSPRIGPAINEADNASLISDVAAHPYSYRCRLTGWNTDCTVVPTANCAIYEFKFPASTDARINFDVGRKLGRSDGMTSGLVTIDTATGTISGGGTFDGNWNPAAYNVYFYGKVDAAPASGGTWLGTTSSSGVLSASTSTRQRLGGWMRFDTTSSGTVRMKIAVSFRSVDRARQYLENEIPGWDMAGLEASAKTRWNDALSVMQTPGISIAEGRKLYTALFHSLIQPRDRTGDPLNWPENAPFWDDQYTLWDTWQTLFPLLAIVSPETVAANVNSFGERFQRNGRAETAFIQGKEYQVGQGGDEVDRIICDAYVKGIPGIDWEKAWSLLQFNANRRTDDYRNLGYVSTNGSRGGYDSRMASGSSTLAFAHGDWCAAQVGFGLGHTSDANVLMARSGNWRNVWDPTATDGGFTGFVRGRSQSGAFTTTAPTAGSGTDFYQGTSWNYSCNVPHERDALIALMGGRARFVQRLEYALGKNSNNYVDFTNEANFQMPFLFGHANRPYLTSYWANVLRNRYGPNSLPGDEDSGAMSSLYFFVAAGIFPIAGQDIYYLHGPRVPQIALAVGSGNTFTISAENAGEQNLYVRSATLNGQPLTSPVIHHSDIVAGGSLAFVMGPNPTTWATGGDYQPSPLSHQELQVNGEWTASLGAPSIAAATTESPIWGSGVDGAQNSAIHSTFPEVTLHNPGDSITLSAAVTFHGLTTPQAMPANRFAWGLFHDNGAAGVTGWPGYLVANDTVDAAGIQSIWRKVADNSEPYHTTGGASGLASFALAPNDFADGDYRLVLTLTRNSVAALEYYAALVRVGDGALYSAFTGSDITPSTFTFNRVGLRAGDGLDADSIEIGRCTIAGNGEADTDHDGIPDIYEIINGMDRLDAGDALFDADHDGLTNLEEYLFGLQPGVSDRYEWSTARNPVTGSVDVTFPTMEGRAYQVRWSSDLLNWHPGSGLMIGDGESKIWTDDGSVTGVLPASDEHRFYRIQITATP